MQKQWRIRQQRIFIYMAVTMVVLVMLMVFLYFKSYNDSQSSMIVKVGDGDDRWDVVSVSVQESNFWINNQGSENQTVGVKYDGYIKNKSIGEITDWKLIITLPDEGRLDSYWNGKYEMEGNTLIITPNETVQRISAGGSVPFGFIMDSKSILEFEKFEFLGFREKKIIQYELFWLLIIVGILWICFLISYIMLSFQIKRYEKRRQNDMRIVSETMEMFARMIDAKDPYTKGHSIRVAFYAKEIGRRMCMDEEEVEKLGYVALMHDCGKIGIPDSVLSKPEALGPDERKCIQEHTIMGGKMLEDFSSIEGIKEGALYHHERYDGKGYPEGLKGEDIPLFARIICIADSFDAMNTNRCYQNHRDMSVILQELRRNAGMQFDPDIVKYMIQMIKEGYCDTENIPEA